MDAPKAPQAVVTALVGDERVVLSLHAVKRWQERFAPRLTVGHAVDRLTADLGGGSVGRRRPDGILSGALIHHKLETAAWLTLGDAVFPLVVYGDGYVATTCIAKRGENR